MTAEVAVMNKSAVALAADSAVTITTGDLNQSKDKVFNTANKLFTLSKYQPVGIMVYNTMELGGVPWETIIKEYRKSLDAETLDSVKDYCDHFFNFLCSNDFLFPIKQQNAVIHKIIHRKYKAIKDSVGKNENSSSLSDDLNELMEELERNDFSEDFDAKFEKKISKKYDKDFRALADIVFEKPENDDLDKLTRIATLYLTRNIFFDGFSGIVITGFGEKEIFPTLFEFHVDLIILGRVKKTTKQEVAIDSSLEAYLPSKVIPFAQHSNIKTVLEGIHPEFNKELYNSFLKLIFSLPEDVIDSIKELNDKQKEGYLLDSVDAIRKAFNEFENKINELRNEKYKEPIELAVSMMPIGELATVAEVFVNIEQIQQRMSLDTETVGGPIDVAVISKHDGFVWIKRKHYFDLKLNPGFVETYFNNIGNKYSLPSEEE